MAVVEAEQGTERGRRSVRVGSAEVELFSGGAGEPVLLLHDLEVKTGWQPFMDRLAREYTILVPSHPGFGNSDLPPAFDAIDDLAYVYQDLLRHHLAEPAHVVGLGMGGWIAAEMAVRCTHRMRSLTLVDAVGIKVSGPAERDIADTFSIGNRELLELSWHDSAAGAVAMALPGTGDQSEAEVTARLRNRQSAALFGWKPFMYTPKLRDRLARVDLPTLVIWGAADRIVRPDYGRAFAGAIPGAEFRVIDRAGHFPYLEQPEAFLSVLTPFLSAHAAVLQQELA